MCILIDSPFEDRSLSIPMRIKGLFSLEVKIPDTVKGEPDYADSPVTTMRKVVW
jgi:hypothetical protein